ncbi:hypothetical protein [Novosphingobium mathurense]|uniref:Uncharacterized protein n=1 Tax=Novosphingobium mathurense TaxID=428990 RepID=A0A1U6GTK1_9SPHN|nr:hypothetical protein [Novosphingobium mathurense]SLJ86883.1 hypothetical protein SAMN06295987_101400 [Novosphingobium mathurense]
MNPIFDQTARAFAALDFTGEEAELAQLEAQRADIDTAIERANARRTEINQALAARSAGREAGRKAAGLVADALLAGAHTSEAAALAPSPDQLQDEREQLAAAIRELQGRSDDVRSKLGALHRGAAGKAAIAAKPLADALRARAKQAAEELMECYAGLQALNSAIGAGSREVRQTRNAAAGCIGQDSLLSWRARIPVPSSVSDVIGALPRNRLVFAGRLDTVPMPENHDHLAVMAALQVRQ